MKKLVIKELCKNYGVVEAVKNLSMEINEGEIYGFIGPNGAGKSTTIRSIMGLINYHHGEILIDEKPVDKNNTELRKHIGYLPSEIKLYEDLTVKGMIDYTLSFDKEQYRDRAMDLVKKFDLDITKNIEELSLGNLKKVGIIIAFLHDPEFIILDEPTSGLDPLMQNVFYDLLLEEKRRGKTILFSTHVLSEVKKVCDRVSIIKKGSIIKTDTVNNLIEESFVFVTINSDNNEMVKSLLKEEKIVKEEKNSIKIIYTKDINILINNLCNIKINKLLIEEPNIEDIFLHYYE